MKSFLLYLILKVYRLFVKIEVKKEFDVDKYPDTLIFAFWHETILFLPFAAPKKRKISILISTHRDGMLASKVIKYFGLGTVGGSSHRNPKKAFKEMLKKLRGGINIGITPDGPTGPRRKLKRGVLELSYLSKKGIVAVSCLPSNCFRLKSWDRMIIPKPFSKLTFTLHKPIFVQEKKEFDDKSETLKRALDG